MGYASNKFPGNRLIKVAYIVHKHVHIHALTSPHKLRLKNAISSSLRKDEVNSATAGAQSYYLLFWRRSHFFQFLTLIANGTIQRVVDQQEFHDALPGLAGEVGVGLDLPSVHDGHGAGGHGLGALLHLHQTHAAVAGDGETVVVAEAGNLDAHHGRGLEKKIRNKYDDFFREM